MGGVRKNHPDLKRMGGKEEKNEINKGTEKKEKNAWKRKKKDSSVVYDRLLMVV